jgi:signal transduction histidine kinase
MWYVLILALVLAVFSGLVYASQAQALRMKMNDALREDGQLLASAYSPTDGQIHIPNIKPNKDAWMENNDVLLLIDEQGRLTQEIGDVNEIETRRLLKVIQVPGVVRVNGANDTTGVIAKIEAAKREGMPLDEKEVELMMTGLTYTSESFFPFNFLDEAPNGSANLSYIFYSTNLMKSNERVGTLILGRPRNDEAQLQSLLTTLLLAAPATLLFAAAGGYWLAARAMRPVRTIAHAAQEIGETKLDRRLNLGTQDELGELAATFDGMLDRLETAFRQQRQFTADASHELRTPLTIVDLEASRALATHKTPEEYMRALSVIQDETLHMTRLVNDLLTIARADAGRITLRHEEIDLSDLTLEVVERLDPLAGQNGVRICTRELPELRIAGDRLYLSQMLTNLVENAIKYSRGIDRRVHIETGSLPDAGRSLAWVRVEDNGQGIAPDHLPHLFDRFYRVDKARSHNESSQRDDNESTVQPGGSGLGLSIVQWIAQAHGGEVQVESQVGRGSTFKVLLPMTVR